MRLLASALLCLVVAACGGGGGNGGDGGNGGGGGGGSNGGSAPEADPDVDITGTTVAAGSEPRQLDFDWDSSGDVDAVDHYRIEVNPDGASGFTALDGADAIPATGFSLTTPVHLTDFVSALYRVVAVDAAGDEIGSGDDIGLLGNVASEEVVGYFKASNSDGDDFFGRSVALSSEGDTLAIGATHEDSDSTGIDGAQNNNGDTTGAVYVFRRNGEAWAQEAFIKASNAEDGDLFGVSVALSGDGAVLAVGASSEDGNGVDGEGDNTLTKAGAAYVFTRSGGNWSQEAYIKADNADSRDDFGRRVALSDSGETLAVSAPSEDSDSDVIDQGAANNDAPVAGAVYVFTRSGGAWSQQAYIKASNSDASDQFGFPFALAGDGDTLAVGAPWEESDSTGVYANTDDANNDYDHRAGAVYVYARDGADEWSEQAYIKASIIDHFDEEFGSSLALSKAGDTLAVGAPREDSDATGIDGFETNNDAVESGAVYVFARSATAWSKEAYVKASNTGAGDEFGTSVALSDEGDVLAVGAHQEGSPAVGVGGVQSDDFVGLQSGAVYVFEHAEGLWSQSAYVKASNTGQKDRFGGRIALSASGSTLGVGAVEEAGDADGIGGDQTDNSAQGAGAVYLY